MGRLQQLVRAAPLVPQRQPRLLPSPVRRHRHLQQRLGLHHLQTAWLAERVDAERMEPQTDGTWKLSRGTERTFPKEGESAVEPFAERIYHFPDKPDAFALRYVRPEEIPCPRF